MNFEFDPNNKVITLCLKALALAELDQPLEANSVLKEAKKQVGTELEEFIIQYYSARIEVEQSSKQLKLESAINLALNIDNHVAQSAITSLAKQVADIYKLQGNLENYQKYQNLSEKYQYLTSDKGPFYHGTKAKLQVGELLSPGFNSNYKADVVMNHIYFTANKNGAGFAAELVAIDTQPYVYLVEPTGDFENDPNVTDKRFAGNPTRSYRSEKPLKIKAVVDDWNRQEQEKLIIWREKMLNTQGEILN